MVARGKGSIVNIGSMAGSARARRRRGVWRNEGGAVVAERARGRQNSAPTASASMPLRRVPSTRSARSAGARSDPASRHDDRDEAAVFARGDRGGGRVPGVAAGELCHRCRSSRPTADARRSKFGSHSNRMLRLPEIEAAAPSEIEGHRRRTPLAYSAVPLQLGEYDQPSRSGSAMTSRRGIDREWHARSTFAHRASREDRDAQERRRIGQGRGASRRRRRVVAGRRSRPCSPSGQHCEDHECRAVPRPSASAQPSVARGKVSAR